MRMMLPLVVLGAGVLTAASAQAHHSFAMFDREKVITVVGTVQKYEWTNPHMHITVVVPPGAQVPAGQWNIEGASINIASRQGWNRNSFKPGDKITVVAHPLLSGDKGGALMYALTADGKKLYHDVNRSEGGGPAG
jgi:hypothetical protein